MNSAKMIWTLSMGGLALVGCSKQTASPPPESSYSATRDPMLAEAPPPADPVADPVAGTTAEPGLAPLPIGGTTEPSITKPATGVAGIQPSTPGPLTDGQIAKVAETLDKGEIEQAREVQKRAKSPQVKKLAAQLVQHHTKSQKKGQTLAKRESLTLQESPVSERLTATAEKNLESIKTAAAPAEAERAYIDAQISQHEEALQLLDQRLIPDAINPDLKAQLEETRKMIETHAQEARKVKEAMAESPAATTPPG